MRKTCALISVILAGGGLLGGEPSREQIERDLVLQMELKSPATIQPGQFVKVNLAIHNRSETSSHRVVAPGDGSEVGWREPYVYYTATVEQKGGTPRPVPKANFLRCGLYGENWQRDARVLEPGKDLPLKLWIAQPSEMLEFQEPGRVRLVAHYRYGAGNIIKGGKPVIVEGLMAGVPEFELVSAPVEFDVTRPLDVEITVKRPITVNHPTLISDLFEIRLVNASDQPMEIQSPAIYELALEIEGKCGGWRPSFTSPEAIKGGKLTLKPGEELLIVGKGTPAYGLDGNWEYPEADTIKVRARYSGYGSVIYSRRMEIKAVEKNADAK